MVAAAKAFFREAIKHQECPPQTITLDGYAASHRAVREMKADGSLPRTTKLRSSKYLNNLARIIGDAVSDAPATACNAA